MRLDEMNKIKDQIERRSSKINHKKTTSILIVFWELKFKNYSVISAFKANGSGKICANWRHKPTKSSLFTGIKVI